MPRVGSSQFSNKARESVWAQIVDSEIDGSHPVLNIIEFLESDMGPKTKLYPMQRLIAKAMYGVPMDFKEIEVPIWDKYREKKLYTLKESEVIAFLNGEGKCNFKDWRDLSQKGYREAMIFAGRRGGKSQLISACACYQLYLLLNIRSPQEYYQIVPGSPIDFTFMAQDEDGANRLYEKLKHDVNECPFFGTYLYKPPGANSMEFVTEADRAKRNLMPSIFVNALTCTTRSARGPSSILLALDEFAHFRSAIGSNSDEVYASATPATMQFENPHGDLDSKIFTITSPLKKAGKSWSLWQDAWHDPANSGIFAIKLATAEMNPRANAQFLRQEEKKDPVRWRCEYGGEFLESTESFVPFADLMACVEPERKNVSMFMPNLVGHNFFWGVDLGFRHDATAVAISHWELDGNSNPTLVYDFIGRLLVGEGKYTGVPEIAVDDVFDWLQYLNKLMPGFKGGVDQHGGSMFTQRARQANLEFIELVHLTAGINSQAYYVFKGLISQRACRFPNEEIVINEFSHLEAFYAGKYALRVEAPPEKDAHDDMADAAALSAWYANNWLLEYGYQFIESQAVGFGNTATPLGFGVDPDSVSLSTLRVLDRQRRMGSGSGEGMQSIRQQFKRGRF